MFLRYAFGFRGEFLVSGIVANDSPLQSSQEIEDSIAQSLDAIGDIDGDGQADALTDGLLLLRYLFGFRGEALTQGVVSASATRPEASQIEEYISVYR